MRATRDASGWKTDEPTPTNAEASRINPYEFATESSNSPIRLQLMAIGRENGCGRRSVTIPTTGCNIDAVSCDARVIRPTWAKSRR